MRCLSMSYLLLGTLLTAGGYGSTFLISAWFRLHGGDDIDTGHALSMALVGTLIGVPLVGWGAGKIDAARLAAIAALVVACGYAVLGNLHGLEPAYPPPTRCFTDGNRVGDVLPCCTISVVGASE